MAEHSSRHAAIVLAAGRSVRFGTPKQLLLFRGEPLLRRAARHALETGASPVFVVLPCRSDSGPAFLETLAGLRTVPVPNSEYRSGMGSSLRAGMEALRAWEEHAAETADRVLLLVADQPLVAVEHLRRLLTEPAPDGIAAADYNSRLGVPAVFGREHFAALAAARGDEGARPLLRTLPAAAVAMPEAALDIDTPEDLRLLTERPGQPA